MTFLVSVLGLPQVAMRFAGENVLVKCESSSAMDGSSAELGPWHRGAIPPQLLDFRPS